jgi:hypothetical protein
MVLWARTSNAQAVSGDTRVKLPHLYPAGNEKRDRRGVIALSGFVSERCQRRLTYPMFCFLR